MVAAWMKIAVLMLKTPPAAKKQQTHRQNAFAEHQNAFTDDAPTGAGEFCKRLQSVKILQQGSVPRGMVPKSSRALFDYPIDVLGVRLVDGFQIGLYRD